MQVLELQNTLEDLTSRVDKVTCQINFIFNKSVNKEKMEFG